MCSRTGESGAKGSIISSGTNPTHVIRHSVLLELRSLGLCLSTVRVKRDEYLLKDELTTNMFNGAPLLWLRPTMRYIARFWWGEISLSSG
jgi:hypothetical protein